MQAVDLTFTDKIDASILTHKSKWRRFYFLFDGKNILKVRFSHALVFAMLDFVSCAWTIFR